MKNNNGWLSIIICGSFAFTAWSFGYITVTRNELRAEHKEDIQLLSEKIDKIYERVTEVDKKITKISTMTRLVLKDFYGLDKDNG
jgi:hypothetical protein